MLVDLKTLVVFPEDASKATTGILFPEDDKIVTGHENGLVVMWDLSKKKPKKLYECSSKIETISSSEKKEVIIGSHSGDIIVLSLTDPEKIEVLQSATGRTRSRVWRSLWIQDDTLITSSTYGVINLFEKESPTKWSSKNLTGHSDSVFSMDGSIGGFFATGDYFGNILVWASENGKYESLQKLKIQRAVEDIAWYDDNIFAAINYGGRIYLFEKESIEENKWKLVFEIENATGLATSINITADGKTVFAGTNNEVIQFDTETQQIDTIEIRGTKKIFTKGDNVFVLTSHGLFSFIRKPIEVRKDLIKYKYVKIGLVGHTGVGKTTLCSYVTTGIPGDYEPTYGKKIWDLEIPKEDTLEKHIILHDYGGQETVLSTFLPFLSDSDIILILFQQTDVKTFDKALKILDVLEGNVADRVKIFFVQTHIDRQLNEVNESIVEDLINEGRIVDNLKVCPKDGTGIDDFKARLLKETSWDKARTMVQTLSTDAVLQTIISLQEENANVISFDGFIGVYEGKTGLKIPSHHLKFLLQNYSNQGIVDYYPEILDLIIFNEPEYNWLKTEIPIFVRKKNGIVSTNDLIVAFKNSKYLPVIDDVYKKYRIAIENFELRIFPELLRNEPIKIPEPLMKYLKATKEKVLPDQEIEIERIIEALSELNLQCKNASKYDGLFSYLENAVIYYRFERLGNAVDGFCTRCTYSVGGRKKQIYERLENDFLNLIERFYGPFLEETEMEVKKKVNLKRDIIYDVALSFASEQREYSKQVATNLKSNGIVVFYDEFFEHKMWGKDLSEYLMNVYYKQSRYCMMFISKDYVSKAWPTHERRSAIARNIKEIGRYILPIRFDESEVPGLPPTIKYIDGTKKTPEDIVDLYMKMLEEDVS